MVIVITATDIVNIEFHKIHTYTLLYTYYIYIIYIIFYMDEHSLHLHPHRGTGRIGRAGTCVTLVSGREKIFKAPVPRVADATEPWESMGFFSGNHPQINGRTLYRSVNYTVIYPDPWWFPWISLLNTWWFPWLVMWIWKINIIIVGWHIRNSLSFEAWNGQLGITG